MNVLANVLRRPWYTALALSVMTVVFTFSIWLPNWRLVFQILPSSSITLSEKASLLWSLYGSIQTNFTLLSASYTIAIAVLFGINITLLAYYIKTLRGSTSGGNTVVGAGGLVSGVFGIGCASCGTFLLSSLLGFVGVAGIITFLPLGGEELGIIGVALLGYSIYALLRKMKKPFVCEA